MVKVRLDEPVVDGAGHPAPNGPFGGRFYFLR